MKEKVSKCNLLIVCPCSGLPEVGRITRLEERSLLSSLLPTAGTALGQNECPGLENLQGWRHLSLLGQSGCLPGGKDFSVDPV